MRTKETFVIRVYGSDRDYLLRHRGTGTPADAVKTLIDKLDTIQETLQEEPK